MSRKNFLIQKNSTKNLMLKIIFQVGKDMYAEFSVEGNFLNQNNNIA